MIWVTSGDSMSWAPGTLGKGYLLHDGTIKTWTVDPFHPEDQRDVYQRNQEISPSALHFEIDPDGGVVTDSPTTKVEQIINADQRLYDAGQRPVWEDSFDIDSFEPDEEPKNSPDFNFVMSGWEWPESRHSAWVNHPPHTNRFSGLPCDCPWGQPKHWHRTAGVNKRRLLRAPDKAYRTPQGKAFQRYIKSLPDEYDALVPYLGMRFKKGDMRYVRPGQEPGRVAPRLEYHDATYLGGGERWAPVAPRLPQWQQWLDARQHPTRRGVNILDSNLTPQALESKVQEHQASLQEAEEKQNWLVQYGGAEPIYRFGPEAGKFKGWQIVRLDSDQAEADSSALGHCIGSDDQPYKYNIDVGNIDAFSLRDKDGYPHVTWHINPSGDSIGNLQGKSGEPKEEYRELISMFNKDRGLPDHNAGEEPLAQEEQYDPYYELPRAESMADYVRQREDPWSFADGENANIGEDTEIRTSEPNWSYIVHEYLNGHAQNPESFFSALEDRDDRRNFVNEMRGTMDPSDPDHREAIERWNSEGASLPGEAVDLPPLAPETVDEYNAAAYNDGDEAQEMLPQWDAIAKDYLTKPGDHRDHPDAWSYIPGKNPNDNDSPYAIFHRRLQGDHRQEMANVLQRHTDWEDPTHQLAIEYWNRGNPEHNVNPMPEAPSVIPGQTKWDWPAEWTAWHSPDPHPSIGPPNWDRTEYVVPNNSEYFPRASHWHFGEELHVGLAIPDHISHEIHTWAKEQDWPKGTELEDPSEYHITLLYSPDGHEEHHDADWINHAKGYDVEVTGLDEFGEDEEKATVLRISSPAVKGHARALQDEAEGQGLEISRFPGGYKPHITVAYGPGKPKASPPKLKFKTGPSSVSTPRESAWHFADGPYGYTNWDTSTTGLMIDNESRYMERSRRIVEKGGTPDDLRAWATRAIIGPYNRKQIADAKSWNAIPLEERQRRKRERDIAEFGEAAVNMGNALMQPFHDDQNEGKSEEEIQRDAEYEAPDLIDPEMVNWDELHQGILNDFEADAEHDRDHQRAREMGLGWATRGGDDHDKMRDAMYRYHGALPDEELEPGLKMKQPQASHNRKVNIPLEMFRQMSGWPEHYLPGGRDNGTPDIWGHRFKIAEEKARAELQAAGRTPEQIERLLNERGFMARDFIKPHFPGGKYDTPINLDDPQERGLLESSPLYQDWAQNGYTMSLSDFSSDVASSIKRGQPHPYTQQMQEALQQRGYTPEQIQQIMQPQWQWDEQLQEMIPVNQEPPVQQWQDTSQDQPGNLTFPQEWTSKTADAYWEDDLENCPDCGYVAEPSSVGDSALYHCEHCGRVFDPDDSAQAKQMHNLNDLYYSANNILAPATELREWLADLGGAEPISPHHDAQEDFISAPRPSLPDDLPYFPPANVPKEYKQAGAPRMMYHVAPVQHRESIKRYGLDPGRGQSPWGDEYTDEEKPFGTYLWENPEDAEEYVHTLGPPGALHDVWAVNTDGIGLNEDPMGSWNEEFPDEHPSWHVAEPITPDRLRHDDTIEAQDWEERYSSVKTADSPITQADATNDPLGKNPAIIPSRKGDPDYLDDVPCPHCQKVHKADEPCATNPVTQFKQMQRAWYRQDPNAAGPGAGPNGLHDQQMDLGRISMAWPNEIYHVSPANNREAIAQEGLRAHQRGAVPMFNPTAWGQGIPGNYAFDNLQDAQGYARIHGRQQPVDIWKINQSGQLPVEQDPEGPEVRGAYDVYNQDDLNPADFERDEGAGEDEDPDWAPTWNWWNAGEDGESSFGVNPIAWRVPAHVPPDQLQHVETVTPEQVANLPWKEHWMGDYVEGEDANHLAPDPYHRVWWDSPEQYQQGVQNFVDHHKQGAHGSRIGAGSRYYHAAPGGRPLMQEGLRAHEPEVTQANSPWEWSDPDVPADLHPPGNYLWSDPERAWDYATYEGFLDPEVYEVDASGLPVHPDADSVHRGEGSVYVPTHIGPERLKRLPRQAKISSDEWADYEGDMSGAQNYVGWVPTDHLVSEFNRREQGDPARVDRVKQSLLTQGFKDPIWFDYHPDTKMGYISEGNHRLTAAKEAGIPAVPVKVMRSMRVPQDQSCLRGPYEYTGNEADVISGDPPQYMHPRDIGLPEAEPWSPQHQSSHPRPDDPQGGWEDDGGKLSAMTLPQQQRQWQALNQQFPNASERVHEFPNGWSVQRPTTEEDVARVGNHMRNCWQGGGSATWRMIWNPHVLHDEHDHPRVAFMRPSRYQQTGQSSDMEIPQDEITHAYGPHNNPAKAEELDLLRSWAEPQGMEVPDWLYEEMPDQIPANVGEPQAAGRMASWDPTTCENCNAPMTEPRQLGNKFVNSCPRCGMTREIPLGHPLLKQRQRQEELSPYPELLNEVGPRRPWEVFASRTGIIASWVREASPQWFKDMDVNPVGLPRPVDTKPNGVVGPVPWSQGDMGWGQAETDRTYDAPRLAQCMVCGLPVQEGKVFAQADTSDVRSHYTPRYLTADYVVDGGALHDRCATMTAAHCDNIKNGLASGQYVLRPYTHDTSELRYDPNVGWIDQNDEEWDDAEDEPQGGWNFQRDYDPETGQYMGPP